MSGSDITTIAIVVSIGGILSILLGYRLYHQLFSKRKRPIPPLENRHAAFSVGGNLVRELTTPITDNYNMNKTLLGRGSSAEVVIGEHIKNKRRYAIKIIDITKKEIVWRYDREKNFLKDIDHTNVVRLYEVYTAPTAMFFVMELCTGGHLGHVLKHLPHNCFDEKMARNYVLQILRALVHLHQHGICHRDIKLQNVLLENHTPEAQVKVIDLGNAVRYRGHTPLTKVVGTTYTAAPEVFRKSYDERCDIWSLGVVTYILLSGRRPFERVEIAQSAKAKESSVIASILMGRYHFKHDIWQKVSNDAIDFIKTCLELDYTKRAYANELLSHPWFVFNKQNHALSTIGKSTLSTISHNHEALMHEDQFQHSGEDLSETNLFTPSSNNISNYAFTLRSSSNRHLATSKFGGMRHTSMLAVAFAMPISKARQLRDLFQEIDRNGNGTIEKEEFRVAFQQVHPELAIKDIDLLFDIIDQDGSKSISFLEFVAATIDPRDVDIKEINQAFKILDRDQKGYLTREDLLRVLSTVPYEEFTSPSLSQYQHNGAGNSGNSLNQLTSSYGNTMSMDSNLTTEEEQGKLNEALRIQKIQEKIEKIMDAADVNKDGVISYTEFLFAMAEGSLGLFDNTNAETLANAPPLLQSNYSSLIQYPFKKKPNPRALQNKSLGNNSPNYNRRQSDGAVLFQPNAFRKITPEENLNEQALSIPRTSSAASSSGFMSSLSSSLASLLPSPIRSYMISSKDRIELIGKGLEPAENIDDSPMYGDIEHGNVHTYASHRDIPISSNGSQHDYHSNQNMSEDQNMSINNDYSLQSTASNIVNPNRPAPMLSASNRSFTSPALLASLKVNEKVKGKERKKRASYHFSQKGDQVVLTTGQGISPINLHLNTTVTNADGVVIRRATSDDDDDPEVSSMSAYMGTEFRLLSQKAQNRTSDDSTQMRKTIFNKAPSSTTAAAAAVAETTEGKETDDIENGCLSTKKESALESSVKLESVDASKEFAV